MDDFHLFISRCNLRAIHRLFSFILPASFTIFMRALLLGAISFLDRRSRSNLLILAFCQRKIGCLGSIIFFIRFLVLLTRTIRRVDRRSIAAGLLG
jgi:hypothetical protein